MYAGRTVQVKLLVWESNPANPHFVATLDTESDSLPQNNSPSTPDDPQSRLAQQYIQQVVIMENTEYRPLRGNISGTLRGTDFRISIPQREMTAKNIPYTALTGKDLEVRLISWDNNPAGPHFCAELI